MLVSTYAGAVAGIDAVKVTVEVNLTGGGLGLYLVGLPDTNPISVSAESRAARIRGNGSFPIQSVAQTREVCCLPVVPIQKRSLSPIKPL